MKVKLRIERERMMHNVTDTKILIEKTATRAWPAETTKLYEHWLLRKNKGVTKRANSVFTIGEMPERSDWLAEIELFYEAQNITPCFYITEATPRELDCILQENNYKVGPKLSILSATSEGVIEKIAENDQYRIEVSNEVSSHWMTSFLTLEGHSEKHREAFQTIFRGIRLTKGFISLYLDEEVVAVATIASEHGWGYVSNVVVNTKYRRRGIASQLLLHLAKWALAQHTEHLFMQVLANNEPALHLYQKLGFTELTKSYYLVKV